MILRSMRVQIEQETNDRTPVQSNGSTRTDTVGKHSVTGDVRSGRVDGGSGGRVSTQHLALGRMTGEVSDIQEAQHADDQGLDALLAAQDEVRTLAIDATSKLEGTIQEVLNGAAVLRGFRDELYQWENRFYRYSVNDLATFVQQYWLLAEHAQVLVSAFARASEDESLRDLTGKLLREVESNRNLLTRACANLGLKLVIPQAGDVFDEDYCLPLDGEMPTGVANVRIGAVRAPGVVRIVEGEEQVILQAFVTLEC